MHSGQSTTGYGQEQHRPQRTLGGAGNNSRQLQLDVATIQPIKRANAPTTMKQKFKKFLGSTRIQAEWKLILSDKW